MREERMADKTLGPLTFGFDIGIASVGWCVLGENRIVDLGVRAFDAAEDPKTGASLNENRRTVKTQRNRLKRRVARLKKLRRLLRDAGAVASADIEHFKTTSDQKGQEARTEPWSLRSRGLDERLDGKDWARVLYHIVKHRGFFAARKSETVDEKKEGGKLTQGVKRTAELMAGNWRTIGEMAAKDQNFATVKRNKAGSYSNSFSRKLLNDEIKQLFARQRELSNPAASPELEAKVLDLFWYQKPAITGEAMLEMMARCTFEHDQYRAPKCSFSAERFIWLSKLNNIKVVEAGERRPLSLGERQNAKDLPYRYAKVTYTQLRRAIGLADSSAVGFAGLAYGTKRNKKGELVDPEEATLVELKGWHALKKELDKDTTRQTWERLSGAALSGGQGQIDAIALALSIYKSDDELEPELAKLELSASAIDAILRIDYTNFVQLSLKAIGKLLPYLEAGLRYDEACKLAGYNHAKPNDDHAGEKYLPAFSSKEIRNPVVFRALNQARKVLNALIARREYGSPAAVHVELARDLSKSWDERKEIQAGQKEFQSEKKDAVDYFIGQIGRNPKRDELLKLRLYRDQDGQCAYSLQPLAPNGDISCIFESGVTQVDHVLPYSRSFDDSQNNKVLVRTKENQDKGNRTPFEYLDGQNESERWRNFEAWVRGHKNLRKAKRDRLLRKNFGPEEAEEFKQRNLNDTRYITKFFADFVRQHLLFAPDESGVVKKRESRVLCPAGGFTSFLRARWGLVKNREQSDLHHAQDACVIAATTSRLQKRVSDYYRKREEHEILPGGYIVDRNTGEILKDARQYFPEPWPHFGREIEARLSPEPQREIAGLPNYLPEDATNLRRVLVSRAVKRRSNGPVHQDTIRSVKPHLGPNASSIKVRLRDVQFFPQKSRKKDEHDEEKVARKLDEFIGSIVGGSYSHNSRMIGAIRERLLEAKGDGSKAFPDNNPLYKPSSSDKQGPIVRSVKIASIQKGGVPVRGGVASQAEIWRVDVFKRNGNWFFVPIYQSDRKRNAMLPNKAVFQGKELSEWPEMTDDEFVFSLFQNDYIEVYQKRRTICGYYLSLHSRTGNLNIAEHDRNKAVVSDGIHEGVGPKTAEAIIKYHVDVLGNTYPAPPESRRGLA